MGIRRGWAGCRGDGEWRAIVTEAHSAIELAVAGVGLAYVFEPLVKAEIASGRLVHLLGDYAVTEAGLFSTFRVVPSWPRNSGLSSTRYDRSIVESVPGGQKRHLLPIDMLTNGQIAQLLYEIRTKCSAGSRSN